MRLDFAVTGLARSRTAWWAAFLSDAGISCEHEPSRNVFAPSDYLRSIRPGKVSGIADTCFWLLGKEANKYAGRILIVHRDPDAVSRSVADAFGAIVDFSSVAERLYDVEGMHVDFDDLEDPRVVADCYEYLTGKRPDDGRLDLFCGLNIQTTRGHEYMGSVTASHWAAVEVRKCL